MWLDVARYGEDDYRSLAIRIPKAIALIPTRYAYRDWVIQAFNDDLPYDKFVKAQLAGDLMDPKERYKMLPATGFLGLGPVVLRQRLELKSPGRMSVMIVWMW